MRKCTDIKFVETPNGRVIEVVEPWYSWRRWAGRPRVYPCGARQQGVEAEHVEGLNLSRLWRPLD